MRDALIAALTAQDGAVGVKALAVLEEEHRFYSSTKNGALDGIPFEHVAHILQVMMGRIRSALTSPSPPQEAGAQPKTEFDDTRVQKVYGLLCDTPQPPSGEHWEGYTARLVVDALFLPLDRGDEWERYHLTKPTVTIDGKTLGKGWLVISEEEYAALRAASRHPEDKG